MQQSNRTAAAAQPATGDVAAQDAAPEDAEDESQSEGEREGEDDDSSEGESAGFVELKQIGTFGANEFEEALLTSLRRFSDDSNEQR